MDKFPQSLLEKLQERQEANALRQLPAQATGADFSSNDYLGFSSSAAIAEEAYKYLTHFGLAGNGATGSRLLTGNHDLYNVTETAIAEFHKAESALIFNSGYDANVGLFSSVPQKQDVVLYDEYIHASIRDGLRLSNANTYKFRHNDVNHLGKLITRHRDACAEVYIAVESVFSMDGDSAPLTAIVKLAQKHNFRLIVDEAHALGVIGDSGQGLVQYLGLEQEVFARIMTFGKGLGCHGAAVLGSPELKTYLVNFARSFIFTTGLPPHSVATILAAYNHLGQQGKNEVEKLKDIVSFFNAELDRQNLMEHFIISDSAIHCAVISGNDKVKNISSVLQGNGFDVKPILSPTVPKGQERLRICLHSYNTKDEITSLLIALRKALLQ
jgi:8-amino-7-oxononanoate synthase